MLDRIKLMRRAGDRSQRSERPPEGIGSIEVLVAPPSYLRVLNLAIGLLEAGRRTREEWLRSHSVAEVLAREAFERILAQVRDLQGLLPEFPLRGLEPHELTAMVQALELDLGSRLSIVFEGGERVDMLRLHVGYPDGEVVLFHRPPQASAPVGEN